MDDKKFNALDDALNAACKVIQDAHGIDDGGYADLFFDNDNRAKFISLFSGYIQFELDQKQDIDDEYGDSIGIDHGDMRGK